MKNRLVALVVFVSLSFAGNLCSSSFTVGDAIQFLENVKQAKCPNDEDAKEHNCTIDDCLIITNAGLIITGGVCLVTGTIAGGMGFGLVPPPFASNVVAQIGVGLWALGGILLVNPITIGSLAYCSIKKWRAQKKDVDIEAVLQDLKTLSDKSPLSEGYILRIGKYILCDNEAIKKMSSDQISILYKNFKSVGEQTFIPLEET